MSPCSVGTVAGKTAVVAMSAFGPGHDAAGNCAPCATVPNSKHVFSPVGSVIVSPGHQPLALNGALRCAFDAVQDPKYYRWWREITGSSRYVCGLNLQSA